MIRDERRAIQLTAWKYNDRAGDAEEVEALACAKGLKLAQEWCPVRAVLETDCVSLVAPLNKNEGQRSRLKFIMDEARSAGNGLPEWTLVHTRRESN